MYYLLSNNIFTTVYWGYHHFLQMYVVVHLSVVIHLSVIICLSLAVCWDTNLFMFYIFVRYKGHVIKPEKHFFIPENV